MNTRKMLFSTAKREGLLYVVPMPVGEADDRLSAWLKQLGHSLDRFLFDLPAARAERDLAQWQELTAWLDR